MKPRTPASFHFRQLGVLASASLYVLLGPLSAAPLNSGKSEARSASDGPHPSGSPGSGSSGAAAPRREYADAYPTSHPAASDLQLTKDDERRADAFAAFSRGILAKDNSDDDAALAAYRKTLDFDPANTQIAAECAAMLLQHDDPSTAILILKDNAKAAPHEPLPLVYLSQIYIKNLKKPELALKYADQALALDQNYFPAVEAVFELSAAQRQSAKAEQTLQKALKAASPDPNFWLSLGGLYAQIHLKDDNSWDSPASLRQSNVLFRKAGECGKGDAVVQAKVGNYFIESKQIKEAIPFYFAAIALKPGSDDPVLVNTKEKLASALLRTGDQNEAITLLEQVTKENPSNFESYEFLGELYEKKGILDQRPLEKQTDLGKALENYKRSTLLDANRPENHLRLADLQMRLKHFEDAVDTARAARARFPDEPETHSLLAIALSQAKHHTEAMTAFAEAKSEFETTGHEEMLNAVFYFAYGAAAEQAGLIDMAAEFLQKSITLDPQRPDAYNYLGYMWANRGEHLDEAGDMIRKAVEAEPENGAYLDSLGWYLFKKGDLDQALTQLLKAVDHTQPEDATVYDHLADIYQKSGKIPEALRYWQKALALHQDDELDPKAVKAKIESAKQQLTSATPVPGVKTP